MRPLQILSRRSLTALLVLFCVSPCVAADIAKDCQSGKVDSCTQILQSNPADFNALANRGVGLRISGEFDRAIADFDAAVRINPDIAGCTEKSLAYEATGAHDPAIRDFSEAIERQPELIQAYFGRAIVAYQATGQRDRSIADMDNAMRLDRNIVAAANAARQSVESHQAI